ncbi:energy-coupling factor transporter transmembrane protein EcfT [Rothia sp. ZJ932]|uniref:energy-coupling factor transporter transmembrane component T family protein n=1 Tax=Rothia sp. ZJ932 TaxID=2810516 RepID=UPI0019676DE4|nr:energy-coupling factor transporter transmembrane protein EcfT [Rothia sp. ZJ932]QRZ60782.1 energy-coupling factor transporter transmembrane protein EcfT [Rothia sp. ZJ932]
MTGQQLFGTYCPGTTPVHRAPLWTKGLFLLTLSLTLALTRQWWISAVALVIVVAIGAAGGVSIKSWWHSFAPLGWILAILIIFYTLTRTLPTGADVIFTLLAVVAASRILLTTTALPTLIDGFLHLISPLRLVGIKTDRFALALALMIRSIPVLFNEYELLKQAAAARGVSPAPHRLLIPWVISAVAYAHHTGDALSARGLPED